MSAMNDASHDAGRRLALVAVSAALVGGFGCATTMLVSSSTAKGPDVEGAVAWKDTIVALGRPGPELAAKLNNPTAMAFIGTEHTYLLVKGGDKFAEIAKALDSSRVELTEDNHRLLVDGEATWGTVSVKYRAGADGMFSADEGRQLQALGFVQRGQKMYVADVAVEGKVYPPVHLDPAALQKLNQTRSLVFHQPPKSGGHPHLVNLVALPATLVVDVVTAPLQLLGLAVLKMHD